MTETQRQGAERRRSPAPGAEHRLLGCRGTSGRLSPRRAGAGAEGTSSGFETLFTPHRTQHLVFCDLAEELSLGGGRGGAGGGRAPPGSC